MNTRWRRTGETFALSLLVLAACAAGLRLSFGVSAAQVERTVLVPSSGRAATLKSMISVKLLKAASPRDLMQIATGSQLHADREKGWEAVNWRTWLPGVDARSLRGKFRNSGDASDSLNLPIIPRDFAGQLLVVRTNKVDACDAKGLSVPDSDTTRAMIAQVTADLEHGIREGSFFRLYDSMAARTRSEFDLDQLNAAYAPFLKSSSANLKALQTSPVMDFAPKITTQQELILEGHFPTIPKLLHFRYIFEREGGIWRLSVLDVRAQDAKSPFQPFE